MQPLIADGGEMTVLRSLASYAWGQWSVDWPDSVPESERPEVDDDRELGYVYKMGGEEPGRMGRRFVRADVSITAADYGPDGVVLPYSGYSDVEATLDAAETRTDGDAFFEREITREGLGPLVPYTDFDVGDIVPVSIWGRVMEQPVQSIEAVSEAGAVIDWRVHVGGELVADDTARRRSNEEIERAIAQERRERLKDVGVVSRAASRAQSTADSAQSTADSAAEDAQSALDAVGDANGVIQRHVEAAKDASEKSLEASERSLAASTSSAQASTKSSLASEAATEAKELSQEAMRAAEVARNEAEQGRNAAEIERMHAEEARSAAEKERQAAFEHRQEAQVAEREASKARHDSLAIQQFYTQGGLDVHRNLILWNRERRTRLYSHVGSGTSTHEDLLQTSDWNEQRGFTFRAPGTWAGRVQIQIEFQNSITGDKAVDMYTYGVGPGNREEKYKQGAIHMRFVKAQVQVEVWLPNNPVFVVQVDPDTGDCIPNTAYDSMLLKPLTFTSDGGVQCYFKAEAPSDRARLGSDGRTFYAKKMNIPGTDLEVWPPYIELKT